MFRDAPDLSHPLIEKDSFGDLTIEPSLDPVVFAKVKAEVASLEMELDRILSGAARDVSDTVDRSNTK